MVEVRWTNFLYISPFTLQVNIIIQRDDQQSFEVLQVLAASILINLDYVCHARDARYFKSILYHSDISSFLFCVSV